MNAIGQPDLFLPPPKADGQTQAHELVRYWRAINRHRLGIALLVIAVGVLASIYSFSLQPIYRGTATVLLDPVRKKSVTNEEILDSMAGTPRDYYLTQIEIMKSRDYAERLVRVLNLTRHPAYDPRQQRTEKGWFGSLMERFKPSAKSEPQPEAASSTASEDDIRDGVVSAVMGGISITPSRNTQLVKVSFDTSDPVLAERVPNALAMIYIVADLEARSGGARQSMHFLSEQAEKLKTQLADSERELQQFRESQKIVVTKGMTLSEATRRLESLTTALEEARRKRSDAELLYKQVTAAARGQSGDTLESLPALQKDPVLQRLKETEAEAERKASEASKRYGPEHPKIVSVQSDLKIARDAVRRQIATVAESVAKEFEIAKANEAAISQQQARATVEAQVFNRTEFPLSRLERNVESNRRLYEAFVQRANETRIGDIQQPIARIVDLARTPGAPSGPDKRRIVMLAMFGALFAGVAIALFLTLLDKGIKTGLDLESRLEVKAVGVLPRMKSTPDAPLDRMVVDDNSNTFSEGIRTIRSDVQLSTLDSPHKTVLVTSSIPGEGKTTVACNLAFAFAQVKKTLLIEADMRRPKVARALKLEQHHPGLSEFVSGDIGIEQCVHPVDGTGLYVLQSGKVPLNPLEMLSSHRFADAMESLKAMFEVIVIDSPPVELVSDSMVLSRFANAVLFVVKADHTPYPLARNSLIRLRRVGAPVLGAVLNYFDVEKAHRYYGDYSSFGTEYYYRNYGYQSRPGEANARLKLPASERT
ncbi:MAG: polysaccharide biosynthesis tyrosine autokinase [Proteobacteria bacterium]|nr:polysaccharide biosynthesis tyrosine autokinase [Pseudomonadota bacterium]